MACEIIDADVVLAHALRYHESVDMAFLRKLQTKLLPDFYLDIDSDAVGTAVWLHSELFAWGETGVIHRAPTAEPLFASDSYMEASYPLPDGCELDRLGKELG